VSFCDCVSISRTASGAKQGAEHAQRCARAPQAAHTLEPKSQRPQLAQDGSSTYLSFSNHYPYLSTYIQTARLGFTSGRASPAPPSGYLSTTPRKGVEFMMGEAHGVCDECVGPAERAGALVRPACGRVGCGRLGDGRWEMGKKRRDGCGFRKVMKSLGRKFVKSLSRRS